MDRFVAKWKRQIEHGAEAAEEDEVEEDDIRDFIVEDEEEEDEDMYDDDGMPHASSTSSTSLAKSIRLQNKQSSSSSSKKKHKKQKTVLTLVSADTSASSSSAVNSTQRKLERRVAEKRSAKEEFKQQQQSNRDKAALFGSSYVSVSTRPTATPSVAQNPSVAPAASSTCLPITRTPSNAIDLTSPEKLASTADSKPFIATATAPTSSSTAAANASSASTNRKRRRVSAAADGDASSEVDDIEDAGESPREQQRREEKAAQKSLVEQIEDDLREAEDAPRRDNTTRKRPNRPDSTKWARSIETSELILVEQPIEPPKPPPRIPCRFRNVIGHLESLRSNSIAFVGRHMARLNQKRDLRKKQYDIDPDACRTEENIMSERALEPTKLATMENGMDLDSSVPFHATSLYSSTHRLHHEVLHHSMKHLMWNRVQLVEDWSLLGSMGRSVQIDAPTAPLQVSYVNNLAFDPVGALVASSSSTAKLDLYDFDMMWMEGRKVERGKRAKQIKQRLAQLELEEIQRRRPSSPPRYVNSKGQAIPRQVAVAPPPTVSLPSSSTKQHHEYLSPIFSMDLHPDARAGMSVQANASANIRQIDSMQWNQYNQNEIAISSQRNNQIFIFDLTRCDEYGSPHRRVVCSDSASTNLHSSSVMDFRWFQPSSSHGGSQTLIAALRGGEMNVVDLRVGTGQSSTDWQASATPTKIFKAQMRAQTSASSTATSSSAQSNPPASLQLSSCGSKLYVFTELGSMEMWDTRAMRASFEKLTLVDSMWKNSNPPGARNNSNSLGFEFRQSSNRICSSSLHPADDLLFLFQSLNGSVGMLDLNPLSHSYRSCLTVVPADANFISAGDEYCLRTRRSHCFLPNAQSSSWASAKREKMALVGNQRNEVQLWELCHSASCAPTSSGTSPPPPPITASAELDLLQRELGRSSDASAATVTQAYNNLHLLRSFPLRVAKTSAEANSASPFDDMDPDACLPLMSMAVHPRVPYCLLGSKNQQIRIAAHESEIERV